MQYSRSRPFELNMTLTRITKKRAIEIAMKWIRREFEARGRREKLSIGYQGGQAGNKYIYCVEDAGIWFAYERRDHLKYYWCAYGTLPLTPPKAPSITIELNSPIQGINRRVRGFIAVDERRRQFLCHTGILGGSRSGIAGRKYINSARRPREAVADTDGQTTYAFVIAELRSPRFIEQVADFVLDVDDFKSGKNARKSQASSLPSAFGGSDQEFEGTRRMPARVAGTASCDHGIVCNRLTNLIREAGHRTQRDQQRDLLVLRGRKPVIEFEVKSSADPQSVYTAVGQLFVHDALKPVKRRVIVLPAPVHHAIAGAIKKLKIDLVTYRWGKKTILYEGLNKIVPGVGTVAPIQLSE